jgi:CDP-diacylglycerol--serine O-phosphatidyltransferase
MKRKRQLKRRNSQRGIYVLPNLLTSANLFCGFYAIIAVIQGYFVKGAIAIMLAALFDALDGKIARVTRTVSRPGILAYLWTLQPFGRLGWLAALLFVACGTLRLARFNTQASRVGSEYFTGLPIPAAAFMIAATVLLLHRFGGDGTTRHVTILIMIYVLSFLMVSTVKYYSFKHTALFKRMKFNMLVVVILFSIVIAAEPSVTLFLIMFAYVLSGPFTTLWLRKKNRSEEVPSERVDIPSQEPV